MTTREFYEAIANASAIEGLPEGVTYAELISKAAELIVKLDERNEHRNSANTKEKIEAAARRLAIMNIFGKDFEVVYTRDALAELAGITPTQASSACTVLIDRGYLAKETARIDKKSKVVYHLIALAPEGLLEAEATPTEGTASEEVA